MDAKSRGRGIGEREGLGRGSQRGMGQAGALGHGRGEGRDGKAEP